MTTNLSEEQKTAVDTGGHVLLTACPGSGKTRVLTFKVAQELKSLSSNKKRIIALTFTNRAAEEIKRRITKLDIDTSQLWSGTIHAFCSEWILRPYAGYLDELKNGFVIADEYKSEELMSGLKTDYGFAFWESITTRLLPDGNLAEPNRKYHNLLNEYHQLLLEEGLIDFDQMLYYAYALVNRFPKIAKTLNNIFQLICVDEYQDTQQLQYDILSKIISANDGKTRIFFVGDEDQAIYGSLGGVAKSLAQIKAEFNGIDIKPLALSGNYRSTQRIVDYYRNYQSGNIEIESLCDYKSEEGLITYNQTLPFRGLENHIAEIIRTNIENGVPENEICVIAPQWWLVIPMGRKLKTLLPNVNFDAIGLSPLLKNRENYWFKVARLFLVEPSPKMYAFRNRWARELIEEMDAIGVRVLDQYERKPRQLLKIINSIESDKITGLEYLEECFEKLLNILQIDKDENPYLNQHWTYFFEGSRKRLSNSDFEYATDLLSYKRAFSHSTGVVVNTCHGIKGEEFHTVISFGLLHGYVPNRNDPDPEAARKMLYVISSRAKKHLHLISETGHTTQWGNPYTATGRLLSVEYEYNE
jgi:DNA helicase II / ATP-dependent DNA helicase PcrA